MILGLLGFVGVLILLWLLVRLVERQHDKKWGGAPKQEPGEPTSMESTTARRSGMGGPSL